MAPIVTILTKPNFSYPIVLINLAPIGKKLTKENFYFNLKLMTGFLETALLWAENLLVAFDEYFRRPYWVVERAGLRPTSLAPNLYRLKEKGIINQQFRLSRRTEAAKILALLRQPWDGYWRLVFYDIPEKNRNFRSSLQRKLKELGLANLQKSLWISPLPIEPWLKKFSQQIGRNQHLLIARSQLLEVNPRKLVAQLWPLESWQKRANRFLSKIEKKKKLALEDQRRFWQLIADHPRIPLELLPFNWPLKNLAQAFVAKSE